LDKNFYQKQNKHTRPGLKLLSILSKHQIYGQIYIERGGQIYTHNNLIYRDNGKPPVTQSTLLRGNKNILKNRIEETNRRLPQTRDMASVGNKNQRVPET